MKKQLKINQKNITLLATIILFLLLYTFGSIQYTGFFREQVFFNLFIDNAYLIIVATGLSFVIITGGIDLSVGALVAFITMVAASLLEKGINAYLIIVLLLIIGALFGFVQGFLITQFNLHPWIVTLGGMFFARGSCYLISTESIVISNKTLHTISKFKIKLWGGNFTSISVIIALLVVAIFTYVSKYTKFGRNVYAVGGNEQSSLLMGLPVKKTKILVYTLSGFTSSLGGVVFALYMLSGYGLHCNGMEMDAIAACVVGGILLTGGFGYVIGPLFGVLSTGIIQTIVMFHGNLNSWWTKIAVGFLLFIFIVLQRVIVLQKQKNTVIVNVSKNKESLNQSSIAK
ncbi:galactofuranose ABC transporter, permease protein YjfF [Vallitalea guaymasensis]|uniref:galactofuranose ABC transporter, permease protein YjfF n=1 Tax=Vallitalea guaymasensis TaxID=1185412 RepID=UPI000DE57784|nr:galactofuranose ABC transporter, permease protein YjfF [Vallitalea guaymasensis]